MANKFTSITTPVGEALFCRTKKTEIIDGKDTGKFSLLLKLSETDTKKLAERIHAEWDSAKSTEFPDKKCSGEMSDGLREYNDEQYFKFSCKESFRNKQGETVHFTVPIFDTAGKEISAQLDEIGNGSKIKVAAKLVPFHMTAQNFGISLRLTAIQVIDYVPYGNAESFGFTSDGEGFRASAAQDDDVPFFDSGTAKAESDGSDF